MQYRLFLLATVAVFLSGLDSSARAEQEVLRIAGSTTVYSVTQRMARRFQKQNSYCS